MKRFHFPLLFLFVIFPFSLAAAGEDNFISFAPDSAGVNIFLDGDPADICVDENDFKAVSIAAADLAEDIERVTGVKPSVMWNGNCNGKNPIVAGTIGKSSLIGNIAAAGRLDVSKISGSWEMFMISTVDAPLPGVDKALVIAGSDRRGTAYGIYELSRRIGVSPWYWWADVTPRKRDAIVANEGTYIFGPPAVKYRGVFLNDEAFGLQPWAAGNFEPETGDIGPKTYEKVFELLLRLKANYIWPAMKRCTRAFNYYDKNKYVADDYAIVMGSSHCEQMLRDNIDEWQRDGTGGAWDYTTNREGVLKYWEDRVKSNAEFENIWTLGMRNIDDAEMPGGGTLDEQTARLENIISDQRAMLRGWVNDDVSKVPQLFSPYKEVLDLYRNGMDLPEDVTILWTDDNWGFIRRLPDERERARSGGNGVYYHISYSGRPHDYLWLGTTPPALIREEMSRAFDFDADRIWVVNVGDIKPIEIGMELFLQMAWDSGRWTADNADGYLVEWAAREFGPDFASGTAAIMKDYYYLNHIRKPENMGFNETYLPKTPLQDPDFSPYNYGDEVARRLEAMHALEAAASALHEKIPANLKDAFYQLVLYPVRASSLMNDKVLYAFLSREYARQGRISANDYAAKSKEALAKILSETEYYNTAMAGGKWRLMMSYKHHDRLVFREMETKTVPVVQKPALRAAVEGSAKPVPPAGTAAGDKGVDSAGSLPPFNRFTRKKHFIDIFNRGAIPFDWKATANAPWIILSESSGTLDKDLRLWVDVDYSLAPAGNAAEGTITISGAGSEYSVKLTAFNPGVKIPAGTFVQDDGVISIAAEHFSGSGAAGGTAWKVLDGLGRTGASIQVLPLSMPPAVSREEIIAESPWVKYPVYVFRGGKARVILQALPTHELNEGGKLRCAVSIDGGAPLRIEFGQGNDEMNETWKRNVLRAMMEGIAETEIGDGSHTLEVRGIDPGIILDKIIVDFGGLRKSYLGPEETAVIE